jgi:hypothetical protein
MLEEKRKPLGLLGRLDLLGSGPFDGLVGCREREIDDGRSGQQG